MFQLIILMSVFICAACLVGGVMLLSRAKAGQGSVEGRLDALTKNRGRGQGGEKPPASVLAQPLDEVAGGLDQITARLLNLNRYIDQAGMQIPATQFLMISGGLGLTATLLYLVMAPAKFLALGAFMFAASLPFAWLFVKRRKRMKKFSAQLADAMDVMSRALRSGYSLPAGIQLVGQQMNEPIGPEFMRCFEQQNLGIPMEQAIREMTERVPNVDLRFFATAVILQRTTGGDLAEILDKISSLIRERFKIWGQIQALTGEGRLSGIVLLALPPALFLVMLRLNYDYVMLLFDDPLGQKMLVGAIILQIIGALVIKKIISIKV